MNTLLYCSSTSGCIASKRRVCWSGLRGRAAASQPPHVRGDEVKRSGWAETNLRFTEDDWRKRRTERFMSEHGHATQWHCRVFNSQGNMVELKSGGFLYFYDSGVWHLHRADSPLTEEELDILQRHAAPSGPHLFLESDSFASQKPCEVYLKVKEAWPSRTLLHSHHLFASKSKGPTSQILGGPDIPVHFSKIQHFTYIVKSTEL